LVGISGSSRASSGTGIKACCSENSSPSMTVSGGKVAAASSAASSALTWVCRSVAEHLASVRSRSALFLSKPRAGNSVFCARACSRVEILLISEDRRARRCSAVVWASRAASHIARCLNIVLETKLAPIGRKEARPAKDAFPDSKAKSFCNSRQDSSKVEGNSCS